MLRADGKMGPRYQSMRAGAWRGRTAGSLRGRLTSPQNMYSSAPTGPHCVAPTSRHNLNEIAQLSAVYGDIKMHRRDSLLPLLSHISAGLGRIPSTCRQTSSSIRSTVDTRQENHRTLEQPWKYCPAHREWTTSNDPRACIPGMQHLFLCQFDQLCPRVEVCGI